MAAARRLKFVGRVGAAALLASLLCVGAADAATLRWANQSEALSLDPHANNETMTLRFLANVYDPLVTRDQDGSFIPWLAVEWKIVEPTRWRFTLRPDVRFENGDVLRASDVVFSLKRAGLPSSGITAQAGGIAGVSAPDDRTVEIVTPGPRPTLLNEISSIDIMDEAWCRDHDSLETANNNQGKSGFTTLHTNGTGAYRIAERIPDQRTVFELRPDWWGLAAGVKMGNVTEVVFTPIRASATRLAALLSGKVDLMQPVPVQDVPRLSASDDVKVLSGPEIRTVYIGLNNAEKLQSGELNPMHDRRVREAMYRAIDVDAIRRQIMRGMATPDALFVPKGVNGYDPALDHRMPFDVAKAKALMEEAGFAKGFAAGLECTNDRYMNDEAVCTAAAAMLARINVAVTVHAQGKALVMPLIMNHPIDMYLQGWAPNSWDSYEAFFYNLATRYDAHPATVLGPQQGLFNMGHYSNPAVDTLLAQISRELDPAKRQQEISDVHRIYIEDIPNIPLYQQFLIWGARKNIEATPSPDDSVTFRWLNVAATN